ncbi:MAG: hypothetical protein UX77_C0001G0004 [Parcubacteria group bacterium GW2011_GWA1_47_11]|uniref:Multidrug ABC transporter substrate-binding protein n=1 Tax=Candidatus Colwellbacteria bacterium GWA2_46_10 TaxID=1797684 RepID=A0A1G1YXC4_9BACT|nr:MAG: hypothetical protein UX29_C0010G0004 [Parcubacteria group bacterium GW2011_GWA2_46_10]KKU56331.1 MAG: hypothetical protein UX77_C0001G0004 [Parcubacteria group bacterium GW2011_GWA1_47_11]OGY57002.1 MAG: hypothetical protein A2119_00275 [Candidatus Colwellbacteria bacterium GWA2_46_10]
MRLKYGIQIALKSLKINRSRSLLTVLGILIGITAIIMMMAIGRGAEKLILGEIGGLGAETVVVRPGREPSGPTDIADTLFNDSIGEREADLLGQKTNVPDVIEVAPVVIVPGSVSYEGETYKPTILGSSAEFIGKNFKVFPETGELFGEAEIREKASVAVIGQKVKEELFGESDALGKSIKIKDRKFRIVGIFESKGQVAFFNIDELVVVPYSTAQLYILGINYFHEIILKASGPEYVDRVVHDAEVTLRDAHNIDDPDKDDFFVVTQQGLAEQIQTIIGALTAFLSSVVAIALVVGGVGVMNIMLVSITERTREIGLRKAVGATSKDIMQQFLLESVLLTLIGGVLGIILGGILAYLVSIVLSHLVISTWTFTFPISAVFLGLGVTGAVGLIFGIYPARNAARKHPTEALRYE